MKTIGQNVRKGLGNGALVEGDKKLIWHEWNNAMQVLDIFPRFSIPQQLTTWADTAFISF